MTLQILCKKWKIQFLNDSELSSKKEIEVKVAQYLEDKFNTIGAKLLSQSKIRYDAVENLENYFEKDLQKYKLDLKLNKMKGKTEIVIF